MPVPASPGPLGDVARDSGMAPGRLTPRRGRTYLAGSLASGFGSPDVVGGSSRFPGGPGVVERPVRSAIVSPTYRRALLLPAARPLVGPLSNTLLTQPSARCPAPARRPPVSARPGRRG